MGVALSRWETECAVSRNKTNVNYDAAIVGAGPIGAFLPIFSAVQACGCSSTRCLLTTLR